MKLKPFLFFSLALSVVFTQIINPAFAAPNPISPWQSAPGIMGEERVLQHRINLSHGTVTPGQKIDLVWDFAMQPEWHIYWQNAGDSGLPPELRLKTATSSQVLPLAFPTPVVIAIPPITNYGYKNKVGFTTSLTIPTDTKIGLLPLTFTAEYLYCKDVCLPGNATFEVAVNVGQHAEPNPGFQKPSGFPTPLTGAIRGQIYGLEAALTLPFAAEGNRFIPAEDGVIDDSAAQTANGNTLIITLDNAAQKPPISLQGILIRGKEGFMVDVPLTPSPTPLTHKIPGTSAGFLLALMGAFLAGLILNLMPCVLPVLSLKLLGMVRHHSGPSRIQHSLAYTAGVVGSFWAFAFIIITLKASGATLGWGFHLQQPLVVAALTLLMVGIALNFWGVFAVGDSLTRLGAKPNLKQKENLWGSVGTGALAVIVATPCTVPFMGAALGYALTQSVPASLSIFTALGLGMAAPFLLIATTPRALAWLPKPGAWMITFKHALGWPMLLTALWLAYVFQSLTGQVATFALLLGALALALSLWLYGQKAQKWRLVLAGLAVLGTLYGLHSLSQPKTISWQPWSAAAVTEAQAQNRPVFVDFTADWCLTCKVTEATVLNTKSVQTLFQENNILTLQADWTARDDTITAELAKHGRQGVPLYLLYIPGQSEPQILPQLLSFRVLAEALENK